MRSFGKLLQLHLLPCAECEMSTSWVEAFRRRHYDNTHNDIICNSSTVVRGTYSLQRTLINMNEQNNLQSKLTYKEWLAFIDYRNKLTVCITIPETTNMNEFVLNLCSFLLSFYKPVTMQCVLITYTDLHNLANVWHVNQCSIVYKIFLHELNCLCLCIIIEVVCCFKNGVNYNDLCKTLISAWVVALYFAFTNIVAFLFVCTYLIHIDT